MTYSITHSLEQVQYVVNSFVLFSLVSDSDGCGCFAILYYNVCHAHCLSHFLEYQLTCLLSIWDAHVSKKRRKKRQYFSILKNMTEIWKPGIWQPTDWKHTLTCLHGDTKSGVGSMLQTKKHCKDANLYFSKVRAGLPKKTCTCLCLFSFSLESVTYWRIETL